ncbi:MAG: DNA ligase (NAD(+)) LigA, partial [Desulfobacterales bacterium CG07_land_8_20_14_0_80_52_14]
RAFLDNERNREAIQRMIEGGLNLITLGDVGGRKGIFEGKTFVITGNLERMTRGEAKAIIEREGGKVGSAVTRGTDFLVAGNAPGSKLMRAREMGIRIIGEAEFYQMLDGR